MSRGPTGALSQGETAIGGHPIPSPLQLPAQDVLRSAARTADFRPSPVSRLSTPTPARARFLAA